jgi:hypothetical protein
MMVCKPIPTDTQVFNCRMELMEQIVSCHDKTFPSLFFALAAGPHVNICLHFQYGFLCYYNITIFVIRPTLSEKCQVLQNWCLTNFNMASYVIVISRYL